MEADGYYIMGDGPEENQAVAKERARADAKRAASEQAGIYVESVYEVKMSKLTRDEIRTISANVMEVQEAEITPEVLGGTTIQYHCHIKARVDTSSIAQQLHQDRQQFEEAVRQNKEMEAQLAKVNAELAELKEKYKTATEAEKQEINREVKRNEEEFTAVQWNDKGHELNNKKDHHGAIKCLQRAIELDPMFAMPWNNMGFAYDELGNYNKAIELDSKIAEPWNNIGSAYNDLGNYDKAIECFRKAIELDPKYASPWNNMGFAYRELGDYPKAVECFRKAVELKPGSESYQRNLEAAKKLL